MVERLALATVDLPHLVDHRGRFLGFAVDVEPIGFLLQLVKHVGIALACIIRETWVPLVLVAIELTFLRIFAFYDCFRILGMQLALFVNLRKSLLVFVGRLI